MNRDPKIQRRTVNIPEAARALGISKNQAYELARQGVIPTLRLGKRLVVPITALERMLAEAGSAA